MACLHVKTDKAVLAKAKSSALLMPWDTWVMLPAILPIKSHISGLSLSSQTAASLLFGPGGYLPLLGAVSAANVALPSLLPPWPAAANPPRSLPRLSAIAASGAVLGWSRSQGSEEDRGLPDPSWARGGLPALPDLASLRGQELVVVNRGQGALARPRQLARLRSETSPCRATQIGTGGRVLAPAGSTTGDRELSLWRGSWSRWWRPACRYWLGRCSGCSVCRWWRCPCRPGT